MVYNDHSHKLWLYTKSTGQARLVMIYRIFVMLLAVMSASVLIVFSIVISQIVPGDLIMFGFVLIVVAWAGWPWIRFEKKEKD